MSIQTKTMVVKSDTSLAETTTTIRDTVTFDVSKMPNGITYKGLKAVLSFADPIQWNKASTYDSLTVVWDDASHGSYASKRPVPANIELTNEFYWLRTADLDAQVEMYRQEVRALDGRVTENEQSIEDITRTLNIKPYSFNTVQDMKNASLKLGDICITNGFYEVGDNGAAQYVITGNDVANGMDKIACNNGLVASLLYGAYITPEQFGAHGNGVSNDTENINAAIKIGKPIVLGDKSYLVDTLEYMTGTTIKGTHKSKLIGNGNNPVIKIEYAAFTVSSGFVITNKKYDKNIHDANGVGIVISHPVLQPSTNTWSNVFRDLEITGLEKGVYIPTSGNDNYASELLFENCKIFQCLNPVVAENVQSVNNLFINCQMERNNIDENNVTNPLLTINAGEFTFIDCSLIGAGPILYMPNAVKYTQCGCNFYSCRSEVHPSNESTSLFKLHLSTQSIGAPAFVNIENFMCYIYNQSKEVIPIIEMKSRGRVTVKNVIYTGAGKTKLKLSHSISTQGITGTFNDTYAYIIGENADVGPSTYEGNIVYAPLVLCDNGNDIYPRGNFNLKDKTILCPGSATFPYKTVSLPKERLIKKATAIFYEVSKSTTCTVTLKDSKSNAIFTIDKKPNELVVSTDAIANPFTQTENYTLDISTESIAFYLLIEYA